MQARNPAASAPRAVRAVIALVAVVALYSVGCSQQITNTLIPNQAPQVTLTTAPVAFDSEDPAFYAYTLQWVGYDPDGRVDHFLIAVDPPNAGVYSANDTAWKKTAAYETTLFFHAGLNYDPVNPVDPRAQSPHTVSIFAVDNKGMMSKLPATRGFFSFTQCPITAIEEPAPNSAFAPTVTPTVTFRWNGQDPDGQFTVKPVRWVFRLFGTANPDMPDVPGGLDFISWALLEPDSLRVFYAPDFPGWNSVGAETTSFQYRNLNPGSTYLFVLTGFDEAGAYDPVFVNGRNMLRFGVSFAGTAGPIIRIFNQFFDYTYPNGGYDPSEPRWFRLEVPANQPITFNWVAFPPEGADIRRTRWVMDLIDLTNEDPRSNETTDWYHWSSWSRNITSATVGPFTTNNETHLFYIEAEDNNGLVSLAVIYFRVVLSTFKNDLLFVDDTRMRPDLRSTPGRPVDPPAGPWPTAAELDTFLFARGGFPWRDYPAGTISPPGIFNGYDYDTIGTRGVSADGTVPLSLLGQYKHVVWYVDETGASYTSSPNDRNTPITALRLVNSPGRPVILSTYMTQGFRTNGGFVWLAGGGAAMATLATWNKPNTSPLEYDAREPNPELRPGRMMYDFVHWREGVQMLPAVNARKFGSTVFGVGLNRPGRHWPPNPPLPTPPLPPNYALLPANLDPRSLATDPPPPQRQPDSFWIDGNYGAEYMHRSTFIREDYNDDPDIVTEFSVLDTLYICRGGTALVNAPVMTYYHGRENQPIVFSGFDFWYWRRTQCIELVDWVLQQVWGLQRDSGASRAPSVPLRASAVSSPGSAAASRAPAVASRTPARPAPGVRRAPR